jgi:hypothetical protein
MACSRAKFTFYWCQRKYITTDLVSDTTEGSLWECLIWEEVGCNNNSIWYDRRYVKNGILSENKYTDTPLLTQQLLFGRSGWNKMLRKSQLSTHRPYSQLYMYNLHKGIKSENTNPKTVARDLPSVCYHPALFVRHIRLTAPSFKQRKFRRISKTFPFKHFPIFKTVRVWHCVTKLR